MKLKLHTKPEVPLEAESITPGVINKLKKKEIEKIKIFHGNREVNIADFFKVTENKLDILEVEGDMHRIKYLGANMSDGEMQIEGNVDGPHPDRAELDEGEFMILLVTSIAIVFGALGSLCSCGLTACTLRSLRIPAAKTWTPSSSPNPPVILSSQPESKKEDVMTV